MADGLQERRRFRALASRPQAHRGPEPRARGVSRSVAMKMTGHKTESVYRRYAIVSEGDLREAGLKLAASRPVGDSLRSKTSVPLP